jgi:hypothetical protein
MLTFELRPCKEVGVLKQRIKDAILDGEIANNRSAAMELLISEAAKIGLTPKVK